MPCGALAARLICDIFPYICLANLRRVAVASQLAIAAFRVAYIDGRFVGAWCADWALLEALARQERCIVTIIVVVCDTSNRSIFRRSSLRRWRIRLAVAAIALRYAACRGRTSCTHGYDYDAFQALAYAPASHTARCRRYRVAIRGLPWAHFVHPRL